MALRFRMFLNSYQGAILAKRCTRSLYSISSLMSKPIGSEDALITTMHSDTNATQSEVKISKKHKAIDSNLVHKDEVNKIIWQFSEMLHSDTRLVSKLHADPGLKAISTNIINISTSMDVNQLLNTLSLLLPICSEDSMPVLESLENHALSLMQQPISISQLVRLVQLHNNAITELGQKVHSEAWRLLEQRWVEIVKGRDIVALLLVAPTSSSQLITRLEDRTLVLCESFKTKELYRILYVLARKRRRNAPLIRAVVYHLSHRDLDLGPVHLANLAFALSILNLHNADIMEKLVVAVISSTKEQTSREAVISMLSAVVQSFGILRYRDDRLLDSVAIYFQDNQSLITAANWHQLFYAAAWLGYRPVSLTSNLLNDVTHAVCTPSLINENPLLIVDFVWSCSVLSALTPNLAAIVLEPAFVSKTINVCGTNVAPLYMKLLNINSVVRTTFKGYNEPLLSAEFINNALPLIASRKHDSLFQSVFEASSQMAPAAQYLRTDVKTSTGHLIDVAMLVNDRIEPQPLSALPSDRSQTASSTFHRIAILLHSFSDMTSGVVSPNGSCALAASLLTKEGFTVVQIPYTEFDVRSTIVKRVQYLHQKLKDAVKSRAHDGTTSGDSNKEVQEPLIIERAAKPKESSRHKAALTFSMETTIESSSCDHSEGQVDADFTGKMECKKKSLETESFEETNVNFSETVLVGKDIALDYKRKSLKSVNAKVDIASLFTQEFEENYQPIDSSQQTPRQTIDKVKHKNKDK